MIVNTFLSNNPKNPKVLITSGWHGDERTGILLLGTFDFSQYRNITITTVNHINTYGCSAGYRLDRNGLSPDDGFMVREGYQKTMSVESKGMKSSEGVFSKFDLHISIHNDPHRTGYYLYTWGDCSDIESVSDTYFESQKVNRTFDTMYNLQDGSYYDYMWTKYQQRSMILEFGDNNINNNNNLSKQVLAKILRSL